jgi:hypothetical protein
MNPPPRCPPQRIATNKVDDGAGPVVCSVWRPWEVYPRETVISQQL